MRFYSIVNTDKLQNHKKSNEDEIIIYLPLSFIKTSTAYIVLSILQM